MRIIAHGPHGPSAAGLLGFLRYRKSVARIAAATAMMMAIVIFIVPGTAFALQEDYEHWKNAPAHLGWTNGELNEVNSDYAEGDTIPLVMRFSGATAGDEHTFGVCYEYQDADGHTGHDYLRNVDASESPTLEGGLTPVAIPKDSDVTAQFGASQPDGNFLHKGFSAFSIISGPILVDHGDRADKCYNFEVTFSGATGLLYYGAHLARKSQWPDGGASLFSGGQLENRYDIPTSQTDMTRGIMTNAIAPEGGIEIVKDAIPDHAQDFGYTTSGTGLSAFTLDDDPASGTPNSKSFVSLDPGSYVVTENSVTGWTLTGIQCTGDLDGGNSVNLAGRSVTIDLDDGEVVRCVFTNEQWGSIVVEKQTVPNGSAATFNFSGDVSGTLSDGQTSSSGPLAPGTYHSTEAAKDGWTLTGITCDDSDSSGDTQTAVATFNLALGETVKCTFTNTQHGSIVIEKQTEPNGASATFNFSGDVAGTLSDGQTTSEAVAPGTYHSSEAAKDGWNLTEIDCDDANSTGDLSSRTATFNVEPGETVKCTFTNTQHGAIIIEKQTLPDGSSATFDFRGDVSGTLGDGDTESHAVAPGTYTSTEAAEAGWNLTEIDCDDANSTGDLASGTATFQVEAGETVKCTFTNTQNGSIVIEKQTDPDGSTATFDYTGDVAGTLGDGDTASESVEPGTYDSIEANKAGWKLMGIVCDDEDSTGDVASRTATFQVDPGETVKCTFSNTQLGTITVVKDAQADSAQDFSFTTSGDGLSNFSLDDDADATLASSKLFGDLLPGTYTVTEEVAFGWKLASVECSTGGSVSLRTATIVLPAGGNVTCTYTNLELLPAIDIVKTVNPESGAPGDTVVYTFVVTNIGNTTLYNVSVDDDKLGHIGDIPVLEVGQSVTLTKPATLGTTSVTNVATAEGADEFGRKVSDQDDAVVTVVLPLKIELPVTGAMVAQFLVVSMALITSGALLIDVSRRRQNRRRFLKRPEDWY